MKSIEERMSRLLVTEQDEVVLNEQMLAEAVNMADALLESNGLELKAESLDSYIEGLQDILENYELSEEDHAALEGFFGTLVRGAGHIAGAYGKAKGTYTKAKQAVGSAIAHVKDKHAAGIAAGEEPKAGGHLARGTWEKDPEAEKAKAAAKAEKAAAKGPGLLSRLKTWNTGRKQAKAAKKAGETSDAHARLTKAKANLAAQREAEKSAAQKPVASTAPVASA